MIRRMNSLTVYALGTELDRMLSGASITAVRRFPEGITLFLKNAPFPLAHILYHRREPELLPSDRELAPRNRGIEEMAAVDGRRIESVHSMGFERVLVVELAPGSEWGREESLILRIDLTPAAKALALYGGNTEKQLATAGAKKARKTAGPNETLPPRRLSILELPAEPPPGLLEEDPREALSPSAPDHTRRWKHAKASADALARSIGGLDPVLAGVLSKTTQADPARLWPMLVEIGARLAAGAWDWRLYEFPEEGEAGAAALYPVELPVESPVRRAKNLLEALDIRAAEVVMPSYVAHLRRKAAVQTGKAMKRLEKLGRNLEQDLAEAGRSAEYRHYGNLLVTHRQLLKAGLKEIVVRDFSDERDVTIPLDPARSVERNIRLYFTKAKKGEKGSLIIRNRKREVEREIARTRKALERIAALETSAELIALIPPEKPSRAAERDGGAAKRFRRFPLDGTHTVYVGRSDAENDILTHEFASASDLWFHAQGTPGSHVVLKGAHRSTPHSVIETAASIAAYFSKARGSSTVPVIYAEKRHVRRPRKSKAGTAICSRGKTIFVKPALPEKE
jgi:predicted ribosome quality control (RQC) complex YloA/Tae2 family protein